MHAMSPFAWFVNVATKQYHLYVTAMWRCSPSDRSQVGITVDIVEWDVEPRCREPSEQRMWPSWCPGPRPSMNHLPTSILNLLGFTAPRKKVGVLQFWHWCTLIFKIFGEAPRVSFWGFFRGELGELGIGRIARHGLFLIYLLKVEGVWYSRMKIRPFQHSRI